MSNHIAIFIDAENLTNWIKNDGVQSLMEELLPLGQIVVRKAYGKWSTPNLIPLQSALNENGFELIHTFHPVSGKNSTDIKMTVDTMEVALDSKVQWIVLATGDSDFSPLFRKLREQGKEVIGVGPKSPLSECVKNSCSRYVYTDLSAADSEEDEDTVVLTRVSEKIDFMEILSDILQKEDGPIHLSSLKSRILQVDNAFSEKRLGFKTFKDFVQSADFTDVADDGNGTILVSYVQKQIEVTGDVQLVLAKILKKKGWDLFSKGMIRKIYRLACDKTVKTPKSKANLVLDLTSKNIAGTTSGIINRILGIFYKAKLIAISDNENEKLWTVNNTNQYWKEIDKAMLDRLIAGVKEEKLKVNTADIASLLYGKYVEGEAEKLINSKFSN